MRSVGPKTRKDPPLPSLPKVRSAGLSWLVWDVGGAERVRPLWRSYTRATNALVFVVDSSSSDDRLEEARTELANLTKGLAQECCMAQRPRPPLLVLANKQVIYKIYN